MIPDIMGFDRAAPYLAAALIAGYFIGSTPFGILIARALRLGDLRRMGSGNIGANNVLRTGHRGAALLTLLLDTLKGAAPTLIAGSFMGPLAAACAGFGAFFGHCSSVFLRFWGGKGVATGFGVFLAWRWEVGLFCAAVWILAALATRIASAASLITAAAGVALFAYYEEWEFAPVALLMALISFWRHRANIGRLWRGQEPKISLRRRTRAEDGASGAPRETETAG